MKKKKGITLETPAETTIKRLKQTKQTANHNRERKIELERLEKSTPPHTPKFKMHSTDKMDSASEREEKIKRLLDAKRRKQ